HQVSVQSEKTKVAMKVKDILTAPSMEAAMDRLNFLVKEFEKSQPKLAKYLEENVPESLAVMRFPEKVRRMLRTTNCLERLNKEVKRRTRTVILFTDEAFLLRLVSAILMEQSEEWETGRVYLEL